MEAVTALIRPAEELCSRTIRLSAIDQIAPRDYNVVHLFFPLPGHTDKLRIFQELQSALASTANEIPELTCAVRKCRNDREELELVYNQSSGAELSLRDYTCSRYRDRWPHGTFDDLARQHFPMSKLQRSLLLGPLKSLEDEQVPGLLLRANFIQGGLILSTSLHHIICDGLGVNMFHQALANHLTALAAPTPSTSANLGQLSLDVVFQERTIVVTPEQNVRLDEFPHWKLVNASLDATSPEPVPEAPVKYAIYFIPEDKVVSLRERISRSSGERFSAVDAMAAFIWTHVIRARQIDVDKYPEAKLSITVDARSRMTHPVVPARYWGNFCEPNAVACLPTKFLSEQADTTASRPEDASELDWLVNLPRAAQRVRQAIAAVDNVAVRRLVGLLSQMPKTTSLTWNVDRWPGPDMLIVCTDKFSFNCNAYGTLGRSEATRITIGNTEEKPDGRCLLLPPRMRDGKGVEVALQYDVQTLDRLKESKDFAKFFTWRN